MKVTAAIARQLELLCADSGDADRLVTGLTELSASLAAAVPSCVSVSVRVGVLVSGAPVTVGIRGGGAGPVLASLAMPFSLSEPGGIVLFQASEAGAFLLLADDLRGLLSPPLSLRIDEHLHLEVDTEAGGLAWSMDELSAVNRAVGVLIERGLPPEGAHAELSRRAQRGGKDLAGASRDLLDSIQTPPTALRD